MNTVTEKKHTKSPGKSQQRPKPGFVNFRLLIRQNDIIDQHLAKIHEQKPEVRKQDIINDLIDSGIQTLIIGPGMVEAAAQGKLQ